MIPEESKIAYFFYYNKSMSKVSYCRLGVGIVREAKIVKHLFTFQLGHVDIYNQLGQDITSCDRPFPTQLWLKWKILKLSFSFNFTYIMFEVNENQITINVRIKIHSNLFENKLLFLTPYKIIAVFFILNQSANFSHFFYFSTAVTNITLSFVTAFKHHQLTILLVY